MTIGRRRQLLMAITAVLAFLHFWASRHQMYWDGISYLEIAARLEVNAYWSPLFSWLLAPVVRTIPIEWQPVAVHAIQAALCVLAVWLSLRLFDRWMPDLMSSEPGWLFTAWGISLWAAAMMVGISTVHPDLLALCLFLLALTFWTDGRWLALGATLGLAYLCKAAMFLFAILLLSCWFFTNRRKALLAGLAFVAVAAPWIAAVSWTTGRLTIGESGRLNYAWEVGEARRCVHWQGSLEDLRYGQPLHPTTRQYARPEAYTYAQPFDVSYPPWYAPAYWYDGIQPGFELQRQMRAFSANILSALWCLASAPGLLAPLVLLGRGRSWDGFAAAGLRPFWIPLAVSAALILIYSIVFLEPRYVAGPFIILSAVPLAEAYRRNLPASPKIYPVAAIAILVWMLGPLTFMGAQMLITDSPANPGNNALLARELRDQLHIPSGSTFAVIGAPYNAEWARAGGYRIVGEVAGRLADQQDIPHFTKRFDYSNLSEYWNLPRETRELYLDVFRQNGARYAIANLVPEGADMTGWRELRTRLDPEASDGRVWFRELLP